MNLPNEIIYIILSFIDEKNYDNVRLVCKVWKELFNKKWNERKFIRLRKDKAINFKKCDNIYFNDKNIFVSDSCYFTIYELDGTVIHNHIFGSEIKQFIIHELYYFLIDDDIYVYHINFVLKEIIKINNVQKFAIFKDKLLLIIDKKLYEYKNKLTLCNCSFNNYIFDIKINNYTYLKCDEKQIIKLNNEYKSISGIGYFYIKDLSVSQDKYIFALGKYNRIIILENFIEIKNIKILSDKFIIHEICANNRKLLVLMSDRKNNYQIIFYNY